MKTDDGGSRMSLKLFLDTLKWTDPHQCRLHLRSVLDSTHEHFTGSIEHSLPRHAPYHTITKMISTNGSYRGQSLARFAKYTTKEETPDYRCKNFKTGIKGLG